METKNGAKWWEENKLKLSLLPAMVFWGVSMLCFVFGLSFKNPLGFEISGVDVSIIIAIALSLANTFVQVVGNDMKQEDMDMLFKLGWWGSYALGIGSNVNTLFTVIGISNPFVQWAICLGLGTMIEVLPEKLFVKFLQSVRITLKSGSSQPSNPQPQRREEQRQEQQPQRPVRPPEFGEEDLPQFLQGRGSVNAVDMLRGQGKPQARQEPREKGQHPTYHQMKRG